MVCVYCGAATKVTNSRPQIRSNDIWRRRACLHCRSIFTSIEHVDLYASLRVQQNDGALLPFNRDRLYIHIYESCKHRPAAIDEAANLTRQVVSRLLADQPQPALVTRQQVVRACKAILQTFDATAAALYAAYHAE